MSIAQNEERKYCGASQLLEDALQDPEKQQILDQLEIFTKEFITNLDNARRSGPCGGGPCIVTVCATKTKFKTFADAKAKASVHGAIMDEVPERGAFFVGFTRLDITVGEATLKRELALFGHGANGLWTFRGR